MNPREVLDKWFDGELGTADGISSDDLYAALGLAGHWDKNKACVAFARILNLRGKLHPGDSYLLAGTGDTSREAAQS